MGFQGLGDHLLETYQDRHGHRIELWCTRRIFDSQFDLRIAVGNAAPAIEAAGDPHIQAPAGPMANVGGCFFDNGENQGPIIDRNPDGGFARVEWITEDPTHRRKYLFRYDFATRQVAITATVTGCAPVLKVVLPQQSYARMNDLLPHPEKDACATGGLLPSAPTP